MSYFKIDFLRNHQEYQKKARTLLGYYLLNDTVHFFLRSVVTWGLEIQYTKHCQCCVQKFAHTNQNKNCEQFCYFQNLHLISFTVISSFLWFLEKQLALENFSRRHCILFTVTLTKQKECLWSKIQCNTTQIISVLCASLHSCYSQSYHQTQLKLFQGNLVSSTELIT